MNIYQLIDKKRNPEKSGFSSSEKLIDIMEGLCYQEVDPTIWSSLDCIAYMPKINVGDMIIPVSGSVDLDSEYEYEVLEVTPTHIIVEDDEGDERCLAFDEFKLAE